MFTNQSLNIVSRVPVPHRYEVLGCSLHFYVCNMYINMCITRRLNFCLQYYVFLINLCLCLIATTVTCLSFSNHAQYKNFFWHVHVHVHLFDQ